MIAKYLLTQNAHPGISDKAGDSALSTALKHKQYPFIKIFAQKDQDCYLKLLCKERDNAAKELESQLVQYISDAPSNKKECHLHLGSLIFHPKQAVDLLSIYDSTNSKGELRFLKREELGEVVGHRDCDAVSE